MNIELNALGQMAGKIMDYFPTLFIGLAVLIIGILAALLLRFLLTKIRADPF